MNEFMKAARALVMIVAIVGGTTLAFVLLSPVVDWLYVRRMRKDGSEESESAWFEHAFTGKITEVPPEELQGNTTQIVDIDGTWRVPLPAGTQGSNRTRTRSFKFGGITSTTMVLGQGGHAIVSMNTWVTKNTWAKCSLLLRSTDDDRQRGQAPSVGKATHGSFRSIRYRVDPTCKA